MPPHGLHVARHEQQRPGHDGRRQRHVEVTQPDGRRRPLPQTQLELEHRAVAVLAREQFHVCDVARASPQRRATPQPEPHRAATHRPHDQRPQQPLPPPVALAPGKQCATHDAHHQRRARHVGVRRRPRGQGHEQPPPPARALRANLPFGQPQRHQRQAQIRHIATDHEQRVRLHPPTHSRQHTQHDRRPPAHPQPQQHEGHHRRAHAEQRARELKPPEALPGRGIHRRQGQREDRGKLGVDLAVDGVALTMGDGAPEVQVERAVGVDDERARDRGDVQHGDESEDDDGDDHAPACGGLRALGLSIMDACLRHGWRGGVLAAAFSFSLASSSSITAASRSR